MQGGDRQPKLAVLALVLAATSAPAARAEEVRVGPSDDLQAAIDAATPGDGVVLADGLYRGSFKLRSGVALGAAKALAAKIEAPRSAHVLDLSETTGVSITGLVLTHEAGSSACNGAVIGGNNVYGARIVANEIHGSGENGVLIGGYSRAIEIVDNLIVENHDSAIELLGADVDNLVRGNLILANGGARGTVDIQSCGRIEDNVIAATDAVLGSPAVGGHLEMSRNLIFGARDLFADPRSGRRDGVPWQSVVTGTRNVTADVSLAGEVAGGFAAARTPTDKDAEAALARERERKRDELARERRERENQQAENALKLVDIPAVRANLREKAAAERRQDEERERARQQEEYQERERQQQNGRHHELDVGGLFGLPAGAKVSYTTHGGMVPKFSAPPKLGPRAARAPASDSGSSWWKSDARYIPLALGGGLAQLKEAGEKAIVALGCKNTLPPSLGVGVFGPKELQRGDVITIGVTIKNQGPGRARRTSLRVSTSRDVLEDLPGELGVPLLAPGGSAILAGLSLRIRPDASPGPFDIVVTGSEEGGNDPAPAKLTLVVPDGGLPRIIVKGVRVQDSDGALSRGERARVVVDLVNEGDAPARQQQLHVTVVGATGAQLHQLDAVAPAAAALGAATVPLAQGDKRAALLKAKEEAKQRAEVARRNAIGTAHGKPGTGSFRVPVVSSTMERYPPSAAAVLLGLPSAPRWHPKLPVGLLIEAPAPRQLKLTIVDDRGTTLDSKVYDVAAAPYGVATVEDGWLVATQVRGVRGPDVLLHRLSLASGIMRVADERVPSLWDVPASGAELTLNVLKTATGALVFASPYLAASDFDFGGGALVYEVGAPAAKWAPTKVDVDDWLEAGNRVLVRKWVTKPDPEGGAKIRVRPTGFDVFDTKNKKKVPARLKGTTLLDGTHAVAVTTDNKSLFFTNVDSWREARPAVKLLALGMGSVTSSAWLGANECALFGTDATAKDQHIVVVIDGSNKLLRRLGSEEFPKGIETVGALGTNLYLRSGGLGRRIPSAHHGSVVEPGGAGTAELEISADVDADLGSLQLGVQVLDRRTRRGFLDPPPVSVKLPTAEAAPAITVSLRVVDGKTGNVRGNGDGHVQLGEIVELTVDVKVAGTLPLVGGRVRLEAAGLDLPAAPVEVGDVAVGGARSAAFLFAARRQLNAASYPARILVEGKGITVENEVVIDIAAEGTTASSRAEEPRATSTMDAKSGELVGASGGAATAAEFVIFEDGVPSAKRATAVQLCAAIRSGDERRLLQFSTGRPGELASDLKSFWSSVSEVSKLRFRVSFNAKRDSLTLADAHSGMNTCETKELGGRVVLTDCMFNDGN